MNILRCPIVELRQYTLHPGQREALITLFDREFVESQEDSQARPALAKAGVAPLACLQTEYAENTFPSLPVRTGEHAFVWFARFSSAARARAYEDRWSHSDLWLEKALPGLSQMVTGATERLWLTPTARSLLR